MSQVNLTAEDFISMTDSEDRMAIRTPDKSQLEKQCADFNRQCPIGTEVHLVDDFGKVSHTRTRSIAWVIGDHTAVVNVEGISGCYDLDRITPV
jgi:hypothetical protein